MLRQTRKKRHIPLPSYIKIVDQNFVPPPTKTKLFLRQIARFLPAAITVAIAGVFTYIVATQLREIMDRRLITAPVAVLIMLTALALFFLLGALLSSLIRRLQ